MDGSITMKPHLEDRLFENGMRACQSRYLSLVFVRNQNSLKSFHVRKAKDELVFTMFVRFELLGSLDKEGKQLSILRGPIRACNAVHV